MQLPKGIFERANLQFVTECVLDEDQEGNRDERSYEERLSEKKERLLDKLESTLSRSEEFFDLEALLNATISVFEDVFFEIGLKVGASLQRELMTDIQAGSEAPPQRKETVPHKPPRSAEGNRSPGRTSHDSGRGGLLSYCATQPDAPP